LIHNYFLDSISGILTIQTRDGSFMENIIQYDLISKKVKWNNKATPQTSFLQQFGNSIIKTSGNRSYSLDANTGANLWSVRNRIVFVDHVHKIGVGFKNKIFDNLTYDVEGINLDNGKKVWKRNLFRHNTKCYRMNDSMILLVSDEINALNIKKGIGWKYEFFTISNIAGDSTDLYIASKERISRVNSNNGKEVWSTSLPKDLMGNPTILMIDSLVILINKASAYRGNKVVTIGRPFIAAFDKDNGKQKFMSVIFTEKDPILSFYIREDTTLYLLFKENIWKYSFAKTSQIAEKTYDVTDIGDFRFFIGEKVYTRINDTTFRNLRSYDPVNDYVYTTKDKIITIDYDLTITDTIDRADLYLKYFEKEDLKFLSKDDKTFIINLNNNMIAELPISGNIIISGKKLYGVNGRIFFEVNLDDITGHPAVTPSAAAPFASGSNIE
jgi:hypothetical protein